MASQIRIVPDALRTAAGQYQNAFDTMEGVSVKISELSTKLNDAWDGGASRMALGTMAEFKDSAGIMAEGIREGAEKLISIAKAFEQVDGNGGIEFAVIPHAFAKFGLGAYPKIPLNIFGAIAGMVRIIPDQVRVIAEECGVLANTVDETAARIKSILVELQNNWEGRSCDKFAEDIKELLIGYHNLSETINDFRQQITIAASRYEELDNTL